MSRANTIEKELLRRQRISETCKRKGLKPPYWIRAKHHSVSKEFIEKTRARMMGNKYALGKKWKCKNGKIGIDCIEVCNERILKEIPELEKQGFRCIPIGGKVRPDIIAIKDNKVFAVEVEYKKPNYSKYTDDAKKYYDDIIWIIK